MPTLWTGCAFGAILLSIWTLGRARLVEDAAALATAQAMARAPDASERIVNALRKGDNPPDADLSNALFVARLAENTGDPARRHELLDIAARATDRILPTRRYWGEGWTVRAYIVALRDGETAPGVRQALARSYVDSPYLRFSGPWRLRFGFEHWDELDSATRLAVANEAVWYSRRGEDEHNGVFAMARASSAYRTFMLRWIQSRPGDYGFTPIQGLAQ